MRTQGCTYSQSSVYCWVTSLVVQQLQTGVYSCVGFLFFDMCLFVFDISSVEEGQSGGRDLVSQLISKSLLNAWLLKPLRCRTTIEGKPIHTQFNYCIKLFNSISPEAVRITMFKIASRIIASRDCDSWKIDKRKIILWCFIFSYRESPTRTGES